MSKLKQLLFSLNETDRKVIEEKLKTQDQQINQLKQQLEELMLLLSKYEIEEHKPVYCTLAGTECEYLGNVHELKQQLAEKDKEIEKLKQQYTILENENGKLTTELIMGKYKKAQKEVSFGKQLAIQELEKVKSSLFSKAIQITGTGVDCVRLYEINKIINQQIKELKGEKK